MPNTSLNVPAREVVILVFDGVQPIDFSGPAQALTTANEEGAAPAYALRLCSLAQEKIRTASGFFIGAEPVGEDAVIDTLVIPGGPGVHEAAQNDPAFLDALRGLCKRARRICAVCTGAFLLAQTGLLAGRRAVTHWRSCERLAREHADVRVESDSIFVRDGNIWTSAGVTAGIDLTLALIQDDHDAALAARVARRLVVYLRRAGGQQQYSEPLSLQCAASARYAGLLQQVMERPEFPWTVEAMSSAAGQSLRSFHRQFKQEVGETPAKAIERIRAELARTYLHTTGMRLKQIAGKVGFESEETMRDAMIRRFGVSPREMRQRF